MTKEKCLQDLINHSDKYWTYKDEDYSYFSEGHVIYRDIDMPIDAEYKLPPTVYFNEIPRGNLLTVNIDKKWFNDWFKGKRRTNKEPMVICLDVVHKDMNWIVAFNPYLLRDQFEYCKKYQLVVNKDGFKEDMGGKNFKYIKPIYTFSSGIECMTLPVHAKCLSSKQPDLTLEVSI